MPLKLYYHPLSSFCWKALIALYENDTPFTPVMLDLSKPDQRDLLLNLSPIGKFPVLHDEARSHVVPESSVIIEYLDHYYPGRTRFIPSDLDLAQQIRLRDRFFDLYVHLPMQKMVGDRMRPKDQKDPKGVDEARARIGSCYDILEAELATRFANTISANVWTVGETFTLADCAAAPALFYGNQVQPFRDTHKNLKAYFDHLSARPSFARVIKEAEPYFAMFPRES
jgi:glutathione S-transferase